MKKIYYKFENIIISIGNDEIALLVFGIVIITLAFSIGIMIL